MSLILDQFCKGSRETLDYSVDFYRELELGEKIIAASAVVAPDTLPITRVEFTDDSVRVWVTAGADRVRYVVTVTADTNQGRRREKSYSLLVTGDLVTVSSVSIADTSVTVGYLNDYKPSQLLKTAGTKIVRLSGETVQIKAINWFGIESSNRVPHGLWADGYKLMINRMKSLGFNAIRLPFAGNSFTVTPTGVDFTKPENGVFQSATTPGQCKPALECLDIIIDYAASQGMWIILDYHRRVIGTGADGNPVGTGQTQQQWIDNWLMLATRYKAKANVIGADLYNEPHLLTWSAWAALAELAGNAIHIIAPHWLMLVEGVGSYNGEAYWQGGQLRGVHDRPITFTVQNRLVYSPHEYGQSVATQKWLKSVATPVVENWPHNLESIWQDAWGFITEQGIAPVLVGEFGGKFGYNGTGVDNQANGAVEREWGAKLVTYLQATGTSFAFWSYNPNSADTGGIVQDNWTTLQAGKVALLSPLLGQ